jgi:hypothetical protein
LNADAVVRYARQIALPEVGPEGQARICDARAVIAGDDLAAETAATYLRAAGVGTVIELREHPPGGSLQGSQPASHPASIDWLAATAGADVVVRSGFDDDALAGAAARQGIALVAVHARPDRVDLLSFPRRAPDTDAPLDVPVRPATFLKDQGAAAVVAGTLAAAEALQRLLRRLDDGPRARHLRLPLDGGEPLVQEIPLR